MAFGSSLAAAVDPAADRKARGAFFTPGEIASFIASQVIVSPDATVLEPSCGEAEFVISACRRMAALGRQDSDFSGFVHACELHEASAAAAAERIEAAGYRCSVEVVDFLRKPACARYDAVLGNPPYVRFQVIDAEQRDMQRSLAARMGVELSALSSTWAPFVLHACEFLRSGGRLGMVLPAELLTVNYAAGVRSFLLRSFGNVRLYTFERNVFPEVQEDVVLLVAEGYRQGASDHLEWFQCASLADLGSKGALRFVPKGDGDRWTDGLVSSRTRGVIASLVESNSLTELGEWGRVSLGGVSGANSFFALSPESARDLNLEIGRDVIPLCPLGSKHMRRRVLDDEVLRSLGDSGVQTLLFSPVGEPSSAAISYIEFGQKLQLDKRYKCRKRSPWWRVPLPPVPDAFITYMNSFGPNLCSNAAGVPNLNSCHGIYFHEGVRSLGMELLPIASFNSATLLSAELVGRAYGGGVQKLEPREASRLLVPSVASVASMRDDLLGIAPRFEELLSARDFASALELVDGIVLRTCFACGDEERLRLSSAFNGLRTRRASRSKGAQRA